MAQHSRVLPDEARYTRNDLIALNAKLNGLSMSFIRDRYYSPDDLAEATSDETLSARLERLCAELTERAIDANPHVAGILRNAKATQRWSRAVVTYLTNAADQVWRVPSAADFLSQWLMPRTAHRLREFGPRTIGDLVAHINRHGHTWYRPIPYLGESKARALEAWLEKHEATVGKLNPASRQPHPIEGEVVVADPSKPWALAPLERLEVVDRLSGRSADNRAQVRPLIAAGNDKAAIEAFLEVYRDSPETYRAYIKECERLLLWSIYMKGKAISALTVEDCHAYKEFLANLPPDSIWLSARKAARYSPAWRPFAGRWVKIDDGQGGVRKALVGSLLPSSQKYAITVIRKLFAWLLKARYLAGDPWALVGARPATDRVSRGRVPLQKERAVHTTLWDKLEGPNGILDALANTPNSELQKRYPLRGWAKEGFDLAAQFRLLRAAVLVMGLGGLRREELANATREQLKPSEKDPELWQLRFIGKGRKERVTILPFAAVEALRAHWEDRGEGRPFLDFDYGMAGMPLIAPVNFGPGLRPRDAGRTLPFSPNSLNRMLKQGFDRIAQDSTFDLTEDERAKLHQVTPHAFRHTFGVQSAKDGVDIRVLRSLLGHADLSTTTIYVETELDEALAATREAVRRRAKRRSDSPQPR
jgi:site-specific recombinase XerD